MMDRAAQCKALEGDEHRPRERPSRPAAGLFPGCTSRPDIRPQSLFRRVRTSRTRLPHGRRPYKFIMARKTLTTRQHKRISIELPPEFIALCKHDGVDPEFVLRGFIADLC